MKLFLLCLALSVVTLVTSDCGCPRQSKRNYDNFGKLLGEEMTMELRSAQGNERLVGDQVFVSKDQALFSGFRASVQASQRWKDNTILYMFDGLSSRDQTNVRNALQELTKETSNCVRFREIRRPEKSGYARVFPGGGCYSYIGDLRRPQDISIGRGCTTYDTIQHEFMHALGFYHEQSRPDRDAYMTVNWENIQSNTCSNFEKCKGCKTTTPYDIESVMQYEGTAFSCDYPKPTMIDKKNGKPIPRNTKLTRFDIKKIRDYYQC